jgi:hypothetical protein
MTRKNSTWAGLLYAMLGGVMLTGCALGEAHGYRVVHSDSHVQYAPGAMTMEVAPTAGGDETSPSSGDTFTAFARALADHFEQNTEHYELVAAEGAHEHTLRVTALDFVPGASETHVTATIAIMDGTGRVTTELEMEVTVTALGEEAETLAGHVFGERLAHYIENRGNYHL